jgi:hypothetical protein
LSKKIAALIQASIGNPIIGPFAKKEFQQNNPALDEKEKGQIGGGYIPFWQVLVIFFMGNGQHKFYANKSKKIESPHYLW